MDFILKKSVPPVSDNRPLPPSTMGINQNQLPEYPDTAQSTYPSENRLLSLRWNGFQSHLLESLAELLHSEELTDVTLIPETGEAIKGHKVILALSSPYFRKMFKENPCKHPIVVLKGIKSEDLQQVMSFIYEGQVRIFESQFDEFMDICESLRIDGIHSNSSNFSESIGGSPSTSHSPLTFDPVLSSPGCDDQVHHVSPPSSWSQKLGYGIPSLPSLDESVHLKRWSVSSGISSLSDHHQRRTSSLGGFSPPITTSSEPSHHEEPPTPSNPDYARETMNKNDKDVIMAEDLTVSGERTREIPSTPETITYNQASQLQASMGISMNPTFFPHKHDKRSTSWPLESNAFANLPTNPLLNLAAPLPLNYFNHLPSVPLPIPRPIPQHPYFSSMGLPMMPIPTEAYSKPKPISGRPLGSGFGMQPSELSRSGYVNERNFSNKSSKSTEYGQGVYSRSTTPSGIRSQKSKTKTIRSSQVPQSSRYSANQVDSMVEQVESFPGPLVPCIVCQKFVKRERLRAHIHECHLLPEEKIECPICKIGLKSKGSYRVHLWRHRRSKTNPAKDGSRALLEIPRQSSTSSSASCPITQSDTNSA